METAFHFDLSDKQLNFKLRERLQARPGIELKGKGLYNTVGVLFVVPCLWPVGWEHCCIAWQTCS